MKKRTLFVTGLLLVVSIGGLMGCKHPGRFHCSPEKRLDKIVKKMTSELELDETQQVALADIKSTLLEKRAEMKEEHAAFADDLIEKIANNTLDTQELMTAIKEKHERKHQEMEEVIDQGVDFIKGLSDEQRQKLSDKLKSMKEKIMKRCSSKE